MGLRDLLRPQERARRAEAARARRERQIRIARDDVEEVEGICDSALKAAHTAVPVDGSHTGVTETRMTRGGLIVRGRVVDVHGRSRSGKRTMRAQLGAVGYVADEDFGADGVVVTGWDPEHYEGSQLTVERIDARMEELLGVRRFLLEEQQRGG